MSDVDERLQKLCFENIFNSLEFLRGSMEEERKRSLGLEQELYKLKENKND